MDKNLCPECGTDNQNDATFCCECGNKFTLDDLVTTKKPKKKIKLEKREYKITNGYLTVYSEGLIHENINGTITKLPWNKIIDVKSGRISDSVTIIMSNHEKHKFYGRKKVMERIYFLTKQLMPQVAQENVKITSIYQKRQKKFLDGKAKMVIELPSDGHSGATRAGATLALGLIGYAATGGKTKKHNILTRVTEDQILIRGKINSEINISDIKNTISHENPPKLTINFNDASYIILKPQGSRLTYPSILNDMIRERMKKISYEIQTPEINKTSVMDEIKKAKELLDMGAINEEEFQEIKNYYLREIK